MYIKSSKIVLSINCVVRILIELRIETENAEH